MAPARCGRRSLGRPRRPSAVDRANRGPRPRASRRPGADRARRSTRRRQGPRGALRWTSRRSPSGSLRADEPSARVVRAADATGPRALAAVMPRAGHGFGISAAYQAAALSSTAPDADDAGRLGRVGRDRASEGLSRAATRDRVDGAGRADREVAPSSPRCRAVRPRLIDAEHQPTDARPVRRDAPRLAAGAVVVVDDVDWPRCAGAGGVGSDARVSTSVSVGRLGFSVVSGGATRLERESRRAGVTARQRGVPAADGRRAARLAGRGDHPSRALATALRDTAPGGSRRGACMVDRIEAHRRGRLGRGRRRVGRRRADTRRTRRAARRGRAGVHLDEPAAGPRPARDAGSFASCGRGRAWSSGPASASRPPTRRPRWTSTAAGGLISLDVGDITQLAQPGLEQLGLAARVELVPGLIEETLASACERAAPIDFALLDADHTEEATVGAFDAIAPGLSGGAIVVSTTSTGPTTCDAPGARSPPGAESRRR